MKLLYLILLLVSISSASAIISSESSSIKCGNLEAIGCYTPSMITIANSGYRNEAIYHELLHAKYKTHSNAFYEEWGAYLRMTDSELQIVTAEDIKGKKPKDILDMFGWRKARTIMVIE